MGCTQAASNPPRELDPNDVTDKIKVFQTSRTAGVNSDSRSILIDNGASWTSSSGFKTFVILDCDRYEIEQIYIEFKPLFKPEIIRLRLSDVGNAYSFKSLPPLKTWKLDADNDLKINLFINNDALGDTTDIYQHDFKRYLRLDMNKWATSIALCRIIGKLSTRIPEGSHQFDSILDTDNKHEDDDAKHNENEACAPSIIDYSPAAKGFEANPIENVYNDDIYSGYIMDIKDTSAYVVVDLGNNYVKEISMTTYCSFKCKQCTVLTGDNPKANAKWKVICKDDAFDDKDKLAKGATYNIQGKHSKYIKLEFEQYTGGDCRVYYGLAKLRFYGDSPFLDTNKPTTLDDIKNMKLVNEDVVHQYKIYQVQELDLKLRNMLDDVQPSEEGIKDYTPYYQTQARKFYINAEMAAYVQPTVFEQEQLLKAAAFQKQIAEEYAVKYGKARYVSERHHNESKESYDTKRKEYETAVKNSQVAKRILQLKTEMDSLYLLYNKGDPALDPEMVCEERRNKLQSVYHDTSIEDVYMCWKDSVEQHPMQISDKYNVFNYQSMIDWAKTNKKEEIASLFEILATLLDESLQEKRALMHKYHLFQLSAYKFVDREVHTSPPIWILLDCKDKKVDRIEFAIWYRNQVQEHVPFKIEIYTADEIIECAQEDRIDIDKEDQIDWHNFDLIQEVEIANRYNADADAYFVSFEDSRCNIEFRNKRYMKVAFSDRYGRAPYAKIGYCHAFVEGSSEHEEDYVLPKHRLKLIQTIKGEYNVVDINNLRTGYNDRFKDVYSKGNQSYTSTANVQRPFFIFDCGDPTRKIEKFEIKLSHARLSSFVVSTSRTLHEEWIELFTDQPDDEAYVTAAKTVPIDGRNERYFKLTFDLDLGGNDGTSSMELRFLKFYTNDPDEYKWDSERNIGKHDLDIVRASPHRVSGKNAPDKMYSRHMQEFYEGKTYPLGSWKGCATNRIRDDICQVVNKLRNRNMAISKHEKHYAKWLLCWQMADHYDEILLTSKRVMNILSKPLITEYKKLQQQDSQLLSLSLNQKDRLPSTIASIHGLLEWDYSQWYEYRKALFYPDDLNPLCEQWTELGLNVTDPQFKHLRRNGIIDKDKSFTSADELAMEYLNLIAIKLDPSFQQTMRDLFEQNRNTLRLKYPTEDADLGVLSGPIKTKARQNIKVKLDYSDRSPPQCMSVLDIVRCAIVCEDDVELCNLFQLICKTFRGKILRVKNAFDSEDKGTYGYRAVLINIAYGDDALLPNGYSIICEAQLLLNTFYQVRKLMHLGYGIVRSEEGGISDNRKPYVVLAQDSCKFGKLDI